MISSLRLGLLATLLLASPGPAMASTVKEAEEAIAAGRHHEAVPILRTLANAGDRDAQTLLGGLLVSGLGVERDLHEARGMFTMAAQKRQPFALYNLAVMYHNGDAGGTDLAQASYWYGQAAEEGVVLAMTRRAVFLLEGQGGPRDPAEGVRWLSRAAAAGDPEAQSLLGVALVNGRDVPADPVQAYVWLLLADRSGFKPARDQIEILKYRLSRDERTRAEQAADAWRPVVEGTRR